MTKQPVLTNFPSTIIATAKKPTTHYNLSVATGDALEELLTTSCVTPEQVEKVVLSTTLATENFLLGAFNININSFVFGFNNIYISERLKF